MTFHDLDRAVQLEIARRGTSHFAHHLASLSDDELNDDSLLPGWTRRHVVAHVGYNAAALCRLLEWAVTGVETPMYESAEARNREINEGATLTGVALRNLFDHTVARLNHKWRTMPPSAWDSEVRTAQGRTIPAAASVWMRTREVWIHAVDLDNGAEFRDFPDAVLESLLTDIVGAWRNNDLGEGMVLEVAGAAPVPVGGGTRDNIISGPLPSVVRWAAGRGSVGLASDAPEPPPWL